MTQSNEAWRGQNTAPQLHNPAEAAALMQRVMYEVKRVVVGQDVFLERVLIGLLAQGHLLIEGVPGLAKTLTVNTLAKTLNGQFSRIQFTPDLLPADLVGTRIFNQQTSEFSTVLGPVFTNLLLADEINRAPAKVQSALLEVMQERQVTIAGKSHRVPSPFLVMATQNPIETEGTYPLPEAQVDRFMLKVVIDYPKMDDERLVIRQNLKGAFEKVNEVVSLEQILKAQEAVREVYMDEKIEKYILDIIFATRYPEKYKLENLKPLISFGASPRGSINLATAAKCYAFIKRRGYVIPEDVRAVVYDVLRHRIGITYEAEAENVTTEDIISKIVNEIEVP
jgi:MoxR-like ATPase